MRRILTITLLVLTAAGFASAQPQRGVAGQRTYINKLAPYVASPVHVVERMLELARLKPGETLYDLGAGDGRILITAVNKFKAKAFGVEISPKLVAEANANIQKEGLADQAKVIEGDVMAVDLTGADVVTLYLARPLNEKLRPRLEKFLKAGARVVSHDYPVPGWKASQTERAGDRMTHLLFLYEIPATHE